MAAKKAGRRMSVQLEAELNIIQKEFAGLDIDGNGDISVKELEDILRSMRLKLKLTDKQIERVLKQIDTNNDGSIDADELMVVLEKYDTEGVVYKALHLRSSIRQEFLKYDEDGNGYITKDEMVEIIKDRTGLTIPQKQIERLMKDSDKNDDGKVNYEEFVALMSKSVMQKKVVKSRRSSQASRGSNSSLASIGESNN